MEIVTGIMFIIINSLLMLAAIGEVDKELRRHSIYGCCFMATINLLFYLN